MPKEFEEWISLEMIKSQVETNWCLTSKLKENEISRLTTWKGGSLGSVSMIDTDSPVTIFAVTEIMKIMHRKDFQVRRMIGGEKYVDFNGKPFNPLDYVFCLLQVGEKFFEKARILVANEGTKSIVRREWLSTLKFMMLQNSLGESVINVIEEEVEKLSA